ncbi:hypothetical protein GN956_G3731 [Arapaima gigas]
MLIHSEQEKQDNVKRHLRHSTRTLLNSVNMNTEEHVSIQKSILLKWRDGGKENTIEIKTTRTLKALRQSKLHKGISLLIPTQTQLIQLPNSGGSNFREDTIRRDHRGNRDSGPGSSCETAECSLCVLGSQWHCR